MIVFLIVHTGVGSETRFALIGDYGTDDGPERLVADLVNRQLQPEFIVTLGDNNYGSAGNYDAAVGKYYAGYIGNYAGAYGTGSLTNRFFPGIGNHDYFSEGGYTAYTNYFTLPGNERYYDVRRGPVHVFVLNSDEHEPDGTGSTSRQAMWLSNRLAASTAPWRIVATHHAPYSSSGSDSEARWPYAKWGADVVLAGHAHNYERIEEKGFPYLVNGVGGAPLLAIGTPMAGSLAHFDDVYGAMLAIANEAQITFEFYSADGVVRDRLTLRRPKLQITRNGEGVELAWSTNYFRFGLESLRTTGWIEAAEAPEVRGTNRYIRLPVEASREVFRLRRR